MHRRRLRKARHRFQRRPRRRSPPKAFQRRHPRRGGAEHHLPACRRVSSACSDPRSQARAPATRRRAAPVQRAGALRPLINDPECFRFWHRTVGTQYPSSSPVSRLLIVGSRAGRSSAAGRLLLGRLHRHQIVMPGLRATSGYALGDPWVTLAVYLALPSQR